MKAVIQSMLTNPEFATLRAGNGLARMKEMGHEAITGLRWIAQNQNTLCSRGYTHPKNRVGMLVNKGLCNERTEAESLKGLAQVEDALKGKTDQLQVRNNSGQIYTASVRTVALSTSPMADLRSLVPTSYDQCGNALTIADQTVSGLLATQDANNILAHLADCK